MGRLDSLGTNICSKVRWGVPYAVLPKMQMTKQTQSDQFTPWFSGRTVEGSDLVNKKAGRKALIKYHQKQAWRHR